MLSTTELDETRAELLSTLSSGEAWLRRAATVQGAPEEWKRACHADAEEVQRLRTRTASSLIKVALLGAFSSGKSFLLSGLQGGLELLEMTDQDGMPAEKFVGLLPSSPVPTNACPATVVPVEADGSAYDASGRGYLRVQFVDSAEDEWEDVGNSPAPSVVAAYVMQDADVTDRLTPHWNREVAEIEILVSDYRLPAKLYDLPGYGSPNLVHDDIVKQAMGKADCFIYVAHAARSLSESDLDLIRFLYAHHRASGKPVLWVVTAADSATQLDHRNVPAWQATIDRNNAYLRQHFTVDGRPDARFIADGFVPVSPASETRAARLEAQGDTAAARRKAVESRMDSLRGSLDELIRRETGQPHLAKVADEARGLLGHRLSRLSERLQTERLPIDELEGRLADQAAALQRLDAAVPRLRAELEDDLREHIKRASRPFNRLPAHLHAGLDARILDTDVRRPTLAHRIQVDKNHLLQNWLEAEPDGPAAIWERQLERFKRDLVRKVEAEVGAGDPARGLPQYAFDINELSLPLPRRVPATAQDLLQQTALFLGISAPIVATGSYMAGLVTVGFAVPPTAAVLGVSALVYMGIKHRKMSRTSLEVTQQEWIAGLEAEAKELRESFELATGLRGKELIDDLVDRLERHRMELEDSMDRVRERMAEPETQDQQELVEELQSTVAEAEGIVAGLRGVVSDA